MEKGCLIAVAAIGGPAAAAPPTLSPPPPSASQITPRTIAPEASKTPPPAIPQAAPAGVPEGAETLFFTPSKIVVEGGFGELQSATEATLKPIEGARLSVAQFYETAAVLQSLYVGHGFALARVTVPPQALKDGQPARMIVVDGFVEAIDYSAVPSHLRLPIERILAPLVNRHHLTRAEMEHRLMLAGDLAGASVRSTIARGKQPGGVILVMQAKLASVTGSASFDDNASAAFAHRDFNLQFAVNSPFGLGEQFYGFMTADPLAEDGPLSATAPRKSFGGGVYLPVGYHGIRFNAEATKSITQPLGGFFRTKDIFGRVTVRVAVPLKRTRTANWTVTPSIEQSDERQTAPDFAVVLSHDHYWVGRIASDLSLQGADDLTIFSATLSAGLGDAPTVTEPLSRAAATRRFVKIEAHASYQHGLPWHASAAIDLRGQAVIKGGLPSGELFGLDGAQALSSFTSGAISGDEGATARGELRRPIPISGSFSLTPYGFGACGVAHYAVSTPFDTTRAAAYGGGVDFDIILPRNAARAYASVEYGQQRTHGFLPAQHRWSVAFGVRF